MKMVFTFLVFRSAGKNLKRIVLVGWFGPVNTVKVMSTRSVYLTALFLSSLRLLSGYNQYLCTFFRQKLTTTLLVSAKGMTVENISFCLCWGLTTRQPLCVILCHLPEKGRRVIEEIVEEMKERNREERGTGMKVKKQKK